MPERQSISQSVQVGVEATPGTAVAANKRLQALGIAPSIEAETRTFRPVGQKYPSLVTLGKEWVTADLSGDACYSEMQYALASLMSAPTITSILDGATPTGGHRWVFDSASLGVDTPKTLTVEQGDGTRAHRFAYGIVQEFGLEFSRESVEMSGTMMGRALQDGITLTAAPTALDLVPVLPKQLDVFLDPAHAGLGTTKLSRVLGGSFTVSGRFGPLWVVDSSQASWVTHLETEPTVELKLLMEADAEGMARLLQLRDGSTRFLRLKATGDRIYTGTPNVDHSLAVDVAGKISDVGEFADEDGVYAVEWTFTAVHDAGWGRAFKAELVNKVSAL